MRALSFSALAPLPGSKPTCTSPCQPSVLGNASWTANIVRSDGTVCFEFGYVWIQLQCSNKCSCIHLCSGCSQKVCNWKLGLAVVSSYWCLHLRGAPVRKKSRRSPKADQVSQRTWISPSFNKPTSKVNGPDGFVVAVGFNQKPWKRRTKRCTSPARSSGRTARRPKSESHKRLILIGQCHRLMSSHMFMIFVSSHTMSLMCIWASVHLCQSRRCVVVDMSKGPSKGLY